MWVRVKNVYLKRWANYIRIILTRAFEISRCDDFDRGNNLMWSVCSVPYLTVLYTVRAHTPVNKK